MFVYGVHPQHWTRFDGGGWAAPIVALYGAAAGLTMLGRHLLAREKSTHWSPATQVIVAAVLVALAWAIDLGTWRNSALDPELSAQGALIMAFLCLQGLLVAVAVLMAIYLAMRTSRNMIVRPRNVTFDMVWLFLLYTCAQGAVTAALTRLFPGGL
jgi:cytochrome c oxidase subunit I+III